MPQQTPSKKQEPKKSTKPPSVKSSASKVPVVKTDRDLSIGAKTGVDLNKTINYNTDPTQIPKGVNSGAWSTFQRYAKDYKFEGGDKVKGNVDMNSPEGKKMYTDKLISDFNLSPDAIKYKANISSKDISDAQSYHKLTDPNVQVDGWYGSQTSQLNYPNPTYDFNRIKGTQSPSDTTGFIPVQYGNKKYVLPANKAGKPNLNDFIPYDPNMHNANMQKYIGDKGAYRNGFNEPIVNPVVAPTQTTIPAVAPIPPIIKPIIQQKAKGGIIGKVKGYYDGGLTGDEDNYLTTNPNTNNGSFTPNGNSGNFYNNQNLNSGVVGQNDQYSTAKKQEDKKTKTEQQKKNDANARATANAAGQALGGYGSAYYASTPTDTKQEATRAGVMGAVSQIGPIGGAIGGIAAIGDKIGAPKKLKYEAMDSEGNLKDEGRSKRNAIGGALLSPSKALAYRSESGNWGDVKGDKYNAFIEGKAKKQIDEVKAANLASQQQQAIAARESDNFNPTITSPYDLSGATFGKDQKLILSNNQQFDKNRPMMNKGGLVGKIKQMYADGGEIKGKGGPKEDKIHAEVEEGSFVVPAKNNELAKGIRELYLKVPKGKKANLHQKEGEEVKLSNGEHLFTPEENEYLESVGVDLEALAPNAEKESDEMAKGGKVDGEPFIPSVSDINKSFAAKKSKDIAERKILKDKIQKAESNPSTSKLFLQTLKDRVKSIDEAYGVENNSIMPNKVPLVKQSTKVPVSKKQVVVKEAPEQMQQRGSALEGLRQDTAMKNEAVDLKTRPNTIVDPNKESIAVAQTPSTKKGLAERIGNIDPTAFVGIGQSMLGINMLRGEKRPIDNAKIDPTYNANVNRSIEDAKFGLTAEQQFSAQQDIQNSLNDSKFEGLNTSGGSGMQAFNTNRAAINDAWRNKLGLKEADTNLRMQKQQYADSQVANRAGVLASNRRMLFNDAMNTFQQKQEAGSELIGAGLQNTIGAYRFQQDKKARAEAEAQRNAWTQS